ncbi:NAD-dependent epimerase/dehydratase family protein [Sphingosinicella soli]|uniref:Nucleoside-diphosphate-sugar epimerase n=1 Tax=Sphingosinicella soli TaxID=333708 RepID=A0A7W7B258_9SPHN|nr:NAD-dependent epimerase/dehydratase family protein [Sphingosinicella soli]MBB4632504.1 nucleoside-diphosphate-sugar epimerase [Sphingosinicella soli]
MTTLAITGGTGFVGSKLIDLALEKGHGVRALARRAQPARPGLEWVTGDLANGSALARLTEGADAVIHVAGVINARSPLAFAAGNVEGTRAMLEASRNVPRFVHVSSLAAREPALSIYGNTKAAADALVETARPDAAIVRPPAVYGPGDRETANVYRLVARGWALLPGRGRFSVVEVSDLASALLALAQSPSAQGIFEIDDATAGGLSHRDMAAYIAAALGKAPIYVPLPSAALMLGAAIDTLGAKLSGRLPALSFDRARYLAHPDWVADSTRLRALGIWAPEVPAAQGIARTAEWYRNAGWI